VTKKEMLQALYFSTESLMKIQEIATNVELEVERLTDATESEVKAEEK
jgi:hypothetical protein